MSRPGFGCVVLSRGDRPDDLMRAVGSLLRQRDVEVDVVVVGNGWEPVGLPDGVRTRGLQPGVAIPTARNVGAAEVGGDALFFLDDDTSLAHDDALARLGAILADDPGLGLVQCRVEPRDGSRRSRDWVPRLRVGDPARTSDVTAVWEGAVALPRRVFDRVGGWPRDFPFIIHEGVDLAWRVMDAGLRVRYAGDVVALHPPPPAHPTRHAYSNYFGARNRVWLARRHLPWPLAPVFVATFVLRTLPRMRSCAELRDALRGYVDGVRLPGAPRRPLRASTLWRMVRAGRPPII
jgi:GT2 family glycosyltransferase